MNMKKVIFMCAISSMILLPSCKRLLNKDSKNPSKEVSKDANDGANSKKDGAGENDKMNTPAMPNSQAEPAQTEPAQTEPAQTEPAQTEGGDQKMTACDCVKLMEELQAKVSADPSKAEEVQKQARELQGKCKDFKPEDFAKCR